MFSKFREHNLKNTKRFDLSGHKSWARVLSIYDGDTITVTMEYFDNMYLFNIRLLGIDTMEIKSPNNETAIKARNRLVELVSGVKLDNNQKYTKFDIQKLLDERVYTIWIRCEGFDKYGRILGEAFLDDTETISLSQTLLKEKLAVPYNGGAKGS